MANWNLNPNWVELVDIVRERVTKSNGLTDAMFNALMENTQYLKNTVSGADVAVGNITTNTVATGTLASVTIQERQVAGDDITYLDFTFNIPKGETGPQGPKGDPGPQGPSGVASGTVNSNEEGTSTTDGYTQQAINKIASRPNLIINPDFSINQRGQKSYSGNNIYTVDRWRTYNNITFDVATKTLTNNETTLQGFFAQFIENFNFLYGKTVTISCLIDNVKYSATATLALSYSSIQVIAQTGTTNTKFELSYNPTRGILVQFRLNAGASAVVDECKLELGSVATTYVAPLYEEEIWKCNATYGEPAPLSNPNLLINPDFSINQRGQTTYTGNGYGVDMWRGGQSQSIVSVGDEGITLSFSAEISTGGIALRQIVDMNTSKFIGKRMSISAKITNVTGSYWYVRLRCANNSGIYLGEMSATISYTGIVSATGTIPANTATISFEFCVRTGNVPTTDSLTVEWAKVEVGSIATEFVPPLKEEELWKCLNLTKSTVFPTSENQTSDTNILSEKAAYGNFSLKKDTIFSSAQEIGSDTTDLNTLYDANSDKLYVCRTMAAASNCSPVPISNSNGFILSTTIIRKSSNPYRIYRQELKDGDFIYFRKGTQNIQTDTPTWSYWARLESANNKITSISSTSTDSQYPSAKAVYEALKNNPLVLVDTIKVDANTPSTDRTKYLTIINEGYYEAFMDWDNGFVNVVGTFNYINNEGSVQSETDPQMLPSQKMEIQVTNRRYGFGRVKITGRTYIQLTDFVSATNDPGNLGGDGAFTLYFYNTTNFSKTIYLFRRRY